MKLNIKKGALILGTIATVVAPIATVVSCGETQNTIKWNDDDSYAGVKAKEFLQEIKHLGKTKQNSITVASEQMMQLQYESESIKSLKAQEDQFKYEAWVNEKIDTVKLNQDLDEATKQKEALEKTDADGKPTGEIADTKTQSTYDGYVDQIKSINDAIKVKKDRLEVLNGNGKDQDDSDYVAGYIKKLEEALKGITTTDAYIAATDATKAFFKDTYKATEFPTIYKPLDTIRDEKTDIVNDAYRQFYPQFTTREDGDKEWPSELAKTYGGAATFAQAIDYLVTQEISSKAFIAYKFEINKKFTLEQYLWAKYINTDSFKFLPKALYDKTKLDADLALLGTTEADIEANIIKINKGEDVGPAGSTKVLLPSLLTENVMFLGTETPNHEVPANAFSEADNLVRYQHMLVAAIQGASTDDVWDIKSDALTKLVSYINTKSKGVVFGADLLADDNLFDETDTDKTDYILKQVSGNSAGTLKIQGSLGVKTELEYIKTMVPGFSLGALAITEGTDAPVLTPTGRLPELDLKVLADKLKQAIADEVAKEHTKIDDPDNVPVGDINRVNTEIAATIKALGDDKVKSIFGRIFKDFFQTAATDGQKLVYTVKGAPGEYVVISQFGFHIIKRTGYATPADVQQALEDDMARMATDSKLTSSTSIVAELNTIYSNTKVMEALIKNADYVTALKAKLDDYNKDKTDEVDQVHFEDIQKLIDQINSIDKKTKIDEAIGDKLEKWLTGKADAGLRDMDGLTLDDIYGWVKKAGGE